MSLPTYISIITASTTDAEFSRSLSSLLFSDYNILHATDDSYKYIYPMSFDRTAVSSSDDSYYVDAINSNISVGYCTSTISYPSHLYICYL